MATHRSEPRAHGADTEGAFGEASADNDGDDLLELIADVHGKAPPQHAALERAVRDMEGSPRRAARAMRNFERYGRSLPTGAGEAATAALHKDVGGAAGRPPQLALGAQRLLVRPARPADPRPPATAPAPTGERTQTRPAPSAADPSRTAPTIGWDTAAVDGATAAANTASAAGAARAAKPTQTAAPPPVAGRTRAAGPAAAAAPTQVVLPTAYATRAPVVSGPPPPANVMSGRGAEFNDAGRTHTHITWPPARARGRKPKGDK